MYGALFRDFFLQREKSLRLEKAERQILQLAANEAHSQAMCNGRVDVQCFAGDALLFFRREVFESAHIVQPVCQFDEHDADVVDHRQEHFADIFRLPRFRSGHVEAADFGDTFDEAGDIRSKAFFDTRDRIFSVFDGIVKQGGGQRRSVHTHVREDVSDFKEMRNVEISGATELVAVTLRGDLIRAAHHPGIFGRTIFAEFFEELLEAEFKLANGAVALEAQRNIAGRRHILVYAGKGRCASCGRAGVRK